MPRDNHAVIFNFVDVSGKRARGGAFNKAQRPIDGLNIHGFRFFATKGANLFQRGTFGAGRAASNGPVQV
jgi:hypothetical protein